MDKVILSEAALPYIRKYIKNWRDAEGRRGGVVLVYNGDIAGWMDKLRDPGHWCPGCLAFSERGGVWRAEGGNDYEGAHVWVVVCPDRQDDSWASEPPDVEAGHD